MTSRLQYQAILGRAAADWTPFRLICSQDMHVVSDLQQAPQGFPKYLQRVVPYVVHIQTARFSGSGTVMRFSATDRSGPRAGWYLLTAAHVLHGCGSKACVVETCVILSGTVTFFREMRRGQRVGEVQMRFTTERENRLLFSPPSRDPSGPLLHERALGVIAVR